MLNDESLDNATVRTNGRAGTDVHQPIRSDHYVQFYESDAYLIGSVSQFIGSTLVAGDAGIIVATEAHRSGINEQLEKDGHDLAVFRDAGQYLELDPSCLLGQFMVEGAPDVERFTTLFGPIIDRAAGREREVRIFAEMVSLLALDGQFESALRLEALWNQLRRTRDFTLFCAYPLNDLGTPGFAEVMTAICQEHDHVTPAESLLDGDEHERSAAIVALQQKAHWLEKEVARRTHLQEQLQRALHAESRARAEAENALRMRDEFLSIAAHELKTPLTSISGYAQLLRRWLDGGSQADPQRIEQGVERIAGQTDKLSRLVTQLLDVSRLQDGQLRLEPVRTDLAPLLQEIAEAARSWSQCNAIVVSSPPSLTAVVDPLRLEQVVTNLLDNAVKYSPDDGAILVTLRELSDGAIELSVRDFGIGIPVERRERIFQRYYQAHRAGGARGNRSGIGIGLYVSQQIVEMHGGSISADFPDDGGTRFVVRLPAERPDLPA